MKYLIAFFTTLSFVMAAEFSMPSYQTQIIKVDGGYATIQDSPNIIVGSSGIVMHRFSNNDTSIIARAVVSKKNGVNATIRFEVFGFLAQDALPVPGILPTAGDSVVLNYLYDRALIVAPNKEVYDNIVAAFPNIHFIHPDIIGSKLLMDYKPNPSRDDFRAMCGYNAAGVIFFALDEKGYFVDCGGFNILKEFQTGSISYYNRPFYSNVGPIEDSILTWGSNQINNYNRYYSNILGLNKKK